MFQDWPEEQVPGFKPCMTEIYDLFSELAKRVHLLIGIGLKLEVYKIIIIDLNIHIHQYICVITSLFS